MIFVALLVAIGGASIASAQDDSHSAHHRSGGLLQTPPALQKEHEHLHKQMAAAINSAGQTGEAAKQVQKRLRPHFLEEEKHAMPPLGLLVPLAEGGPTPEMRPAIEMAEWLRTNYRRMLQEHQAIVGSLEKLKEAAQKENKPEQAAFAEKLILHAQTEEQVLYPTTLLIGDYLKTQLGEQPQ
jgi:hypothetical protein